MVVFNGDVYIQGAVEIFALKLAIAAMTSLRIFGGVFEVHSLNGYIYIKNKVLVL